MKNILYLSLALLIFACSSGGDDDNNNTTNSEFQGEWSGTFSGDDNGTWSAGINSNGDVSGDCLLHHFC